VDVRPEGPRRVYSLRPEPFRELDAWVTDYRALWEARLDRFGAALRQRQKRGAGLRKQRAKCESDEDAMTATEEQRHE
jgi:hypothetical protein